MPQMDARPPARTVLIVDGDPEALARTVEVVTTGGYRAMGVSTFEEARQLLTVNVPDVLIADVRLGAFNGLHLVLHCRLKHPRVASIVTHAYHDVVLEAEARKLDAPYLVTPLKPEELLAHVARVRASGSPTMSSAFRRWPRKPVTGGFVARINELPAVVLDVSYEGVRFEMPRVPERVLASSFTVSIPAFGLAVRARQAWIQHLRTSRSLWCGAAIVETTPDAREAWRSLVDTLGSP